MAIRRKLSTGISVAALAALAPVAAVHAQQTASQMRGTIVDGAGTPVADATVTIRHEPSGTVSRATTSANGNFNASGLRVGGPYTVSASAEGFTAESVEGLNLAPGSNPPVRVRVASVGTEVIQVSGTRVRSINLNNGAGSSFTAQDIANQPSFSRDVLDTLLRDPLTNTSGGSGNLSIAGANPRLNAFAVDGALQQDDFGLGSSTYPTGRSPLSLDTIEAASVAASDYSVTVGGFQGGLVNVVTRSGTNDFSGSVFYYRSGNDFQSNTAFGRFIDSPDFIEEEYGFTLGGPIIQDRLFFFVGYENFETARPVSNIGSDQNSGRDPAVFPALRQLIQDSLGYDVGPRPDIASIPSTSERILGKIDWNVTDNHRLSFSYQQTDEVDTSGTGSTRFQSAWNDNPRELKTYTFQAYSDWTENFSTTFRMSYKDLIRGQNCRAGTDIGQIQIFLNGDEVPGTPLDGLLEPGQNLSVIAGCDRSRHANEFTDERFQVFAQGDYQLGDHLITFGANFESYELFNLFVQDASGNFQFGSGSRSGVEDLMNREAFVTYRGVPSNVREDGATELGYDILTLFAQNEWQATPNLTVNAGIRYERYGQSEPQVDRQDFFNAYGRSNQKNLDGLDIIQPRAGFRWDVLPRTTISGGVGLFSGGDPKVWFSNTYLPQLFTDRMLIEGVDPRVIPQPLLDFVANADPATPAPIDTIAPDFEIPSEWRASLKVAQTFDLLFDGLDLGSDYLFEAQVLRSETNYDYAWRNLAQTELGLPQGVAPDGRPIYANIQLEDAQNAIELYNTREGGGWIYTVSLANEFENGLGFYLSYAHQDLESTTPGSASVAVSNHLGLVDFDRNSPNLFRSDFEVRHRFGLNFSYQNEFFGDLRTRFDVSGIIRSGNPYSLTFQTNQNRAPFGRSDIQFNSGNDLLYVPLQDDPRVVYGDNFDVEGFNAFIERRGLERGQIVERNRDYSPWIQQWNLRIQQDLPFADLGLSRFEGNRAQLVVDVENFPNLLNNEWGANRGSFGRSSTIAAVDVIDETGEVLTGTEPARTCVTEDSCRYLYTNYFDRTTFGSESLGRSLYRIRVGLRYEF